MSPPASLTLAIHHDRYLPPEGGLLDVILAVEAKAAGSAAPAGTDDAPGLAEVILLDCSGSMGVPQTKIHAARQAAVAAIDVLRDGVAFAVVEGFDRAQLVYPFPTKGIPQGMAVADERIRAAARAAVRRLTAHGGTAIGSWLRLANKLLSSWPDAIGHAIMLTDGRNETESRADLDAAVAACAGRFTVDCRAIGSAAGIHDWDGPELLRIAAALGANPVVPVEDLTTLAGEFTAMMDHAMARTVGDVRLRVSTPGLARVRFLKQVHPVIADLTSSGVPVEAQIVDYPSGAWSPGDHRDYHLRLEVAAAAPGSRGRAAWVSLRSGARFADLEAAESPVEVEWSDSAPWYTEISAGVVHYTLQQDHTNAMRLAWEAFQAGRLGEAEQLLGRAVALACQIGDEEKLRLLERIVEIDDPAAGHVRLKPDVDPRLWQPSTVRSTQTTAWRANATPLPASPPRAAPVISGPCAHCGTTLAGPFCEECGKSAAAGGPPSEPI